MISFHGIDVIQRRPPRVRNASLRWQSNVSLSLHTSKNSKRFHKCVWPGEISARSNVTGKQPQADHHHRFSPLCSAGLTDGKFTVLSTIRTTIRKTNLLPHSAQMLLKQCALLLKASPKYVDVVNCMMYLNTNH